MTRRARTATLAVAVVLLVLLGTAAYLRPVPYVVLSPGPVFNALGDIAGVPVVTVDGAPTYATDGTLDVTTVYESGGPGSTVTLPQVFRAWLDSAQQVLPRDLLYPEDSNPSQNQQQAVEQMELSQQTAVAAALRHLDLPVRTAVAVGTVLEDSPAEGKLRAGDEFVRVDGQRVQGPRQVGRLISQRKPGDPVDLVVRRDGELVRLTLVTEPAPDDPSRAIVGVIPTLVYVSPIDVTIKLGNVGGPSAGLMFSLSVVDKLTPGPLTGGEHVAGTGTIDARGHVGAIGGIQQKMAGARGDGADLFLAPKSNCSDVVGNVPRGLTVVPVQTLDDAIDVVGRFADGDRDFATCTG